MIKTPGCLSITFAEITPPPTSQQRDLPFMFSCQEDPPLPVETQMPNPQLPSSRYIQSTGEQHRPCHVNLKESLPGATRKHFVSGEGASQGEMLSSSSRYSCTCPEPEASVRSSHQDGDTASVLSKAEQRETKHKNAEFMRTLWSCWINHPEITLPPDFLCDITDTLIVWVSA